MSDAAQTTLVKRAREAAARGEWQQAHQLLVEADATASLSGSDLAFLADMAYAAGYLDTTITAWERLYSESVRRGDNLAAAGAAVRVALHLLFDTALMAPVRGWLKRVEQLLEGHSETPIHAWLAVVRSYERLLSGDVQTAEIWARRAVEVGANHDAAAAAIGRVAEARSLVLQGRVAEGLGLLNEAGVAATSGELDPIATGVVYCELICALQGLAQYDLAEEWTAAMERWRQGQPVGSIHGRCRVHRAEILRLRGSCAEAEDEALLACEELRPYLRRELGWPLTELGRIRLRRGDIAGAEQAFLAAHEASWDPQPGLALVRLAKNDVAGAADSIRSALEHPLNVPSKEMPPNNELRRAPLLEAQIEIEIAGGNVSVARAAAEELSTIAARFESKALIATAALAQGRVKLAEGDTARARDEFEKAALLWAEVGAPYETTLARDGLTRSGGGEAATEQAARESQARAPAADECRFRREGDFWSLVFDGQHVQLRDRKGLHYLARLLANPGREFHVLDLTSRERAPSLDPISPRAEGDFALSVEGGGELFIDAEAKEAYRRRLAEIDEDIEEARAMGDERLEQAQIERDFLLRELARAVGLGGRNRRRGSRSERARVSITRAIRQAIAHLESHHPVLGAHLTRTIRTGTYCVYLPDPRLSLRWNVATGSTS